MDQHHNLTDAGRNHMRKGRVGMRCLMGCQIEDVNVQTFDPDHRRLSQKLVGMMYKIWRRPNMASVGL